MASRISCAQGTKSQMMVAFSRLAVSKIQAGDTPRKSTPRLPATRLPNQCILAPVWYSGGMHKNTSSRVWPWWFCSVRAACIRLRWLCKMALGKPVVPEE